MLFVSRIRDLRLIRRPSDRIMDEQRNPIILRGERVEFSNFRYTTEDEGLIEWLVNHPLYGNTFTSDKLRDRAVGKGFQATGDTSDYSAVQAARAVIKDYDNRTVEGGQAFNKALKDHKKKKAGPQMLKGMMATVQSFPGPGDAKESENREPELTKEDVATMIKSEITTAMAQIVDLIRTNNPPTKKKEFHCPECGEEFPSGIAVGKHKAEAHSTPEVKE